MIHLQANCLSRNLFRPNTFLCLKEGVGIFAYYEKILQF